jgi:hypothetical protein
MSKTSKFRITYKDGTTKEVNAALHAGYLCIPTFISDGFEYYKKRVNYDPWDDDEPEYETKRRTKYRNDYKPFLNRAALIADGKLKDAEKLAKQSTFAAYKGWEKYFLHVGENFGGSIIESL